MKKTKKEALQLCARFALPPNSLGYCGRNSAPERFKACVINGKCTDVETEFKKFIVLNPYIKTISKLTQKAYADYEVIESYWLGNNQLKKAKAKDYADLIKNFKKQGVPDWLVNELKTKIPTKFIPTHLFQILHVGVGRASGSVPFNIETVNNCMIRWGKVIKFKDNQATVKLTSLKKLATKYKLTYITETHPYIPEFLPNLKVGDTVAVHWKQVVKKLTKNEEKNLAYWTNQVLSNVH